MNKQIIFCIAWSILGLHALVGETLASYNNSSPIHSAAGSIQVDVDYEKSILPFLKKYCMECHAPGDMENLDFLSASSAAEVRKNRELFAGVFETLHSQSMPPKDFEQPTDGERKLISNWIKKTLELKPEDTERVAQYVVDAFEDRDGNLWFGTMQKGVAKFDGKQLSFFTKKNGLPSNTVPSITQDSAGTIWLGTHSGVAKFVGQEFVPVGVADGLPQTLGSGPASSAGVKTDRKGNVWVSQGQRLFRQEGNSFSEFKVPVPTKQAESFAILAGDTSFHLEDRNGNLWFSSDGYGIYQYNGTSFKRYTKSDGLCSNNITSIIEDRKGNIWASCMQSYQPTMTGDGGVCRLDGESFVQFPNVKGLTKNDIYTIYETRSGHIWICATGVGAYRYNGDSFSMFNETDRKHWTRNFGIQCILEDRNGTVWFGFSGGLFRFNGKSFYNINHSGPWTGLYTAMANAVSGKEIRADILPLQMQKALAAVATDQLETAKASLSKMRQEFPAAPTLQEFTLNQVGYRLVFTKRLEDAIKIFQLNTILNPNVANTFDSLAEAHLRNGDYEKAELNYQKALELDPENQATQKAINEIAARNRYKDALTAPTGWMEEVISLPRNFAPSMKITGMEHLRLPPKFRDPESDWFCSYLFAMELSKPQPINETFISEQLLAYFQGLANGGRDKEGTKIDVSKFSIEQMNTHASVGNESFDFALKWQEPFVNATPQRLNIRVKFMRGKSEHGVLFVCGSPTSFESNTWKELLRIRSNFESNPIQTEE